jgi:hypothetical protein
MFGGIVGYYVGAQELLGIQSEEVVRRPSERTPTQTPSETPTQTPPETSTQTPSDSTRLATFEDGSLDAWTDVDNARITDEKAFSGTNSVVVIDQNEDGGVGGSIIRPVDSRRPNRLSGAFQAGEGTTPTVVVRWRDSQQKPVHTVRMSIPRNNIQYPGEQSRRPFYQGVETSNWYQFTLDNLDWENENVGEIKLNGEVMAENVPFGSSSSGSISDVQLRCHSGGTGMKAYFDDVTIG